MGRVIVTGEKFYGVMIRYTKTEDGLRRVTCPRQKEIYATPNPLHQYNLRAEEEDGPDDDDDEATGSVAGSCKFLRRFLGGSQPSESEVCRGLPLVGGRTPSTGRARFVGLEFLYGSERLEVSRGLRLEGGGTLSTSRARFVGIAFLYGSERLDVSRGLRLAPGAGALLSRAFIGAEWSSIQCTADRKSFPCGRSPVSVSGCGTC
jgi:hypothetical protein